MRPASPSSTSAPADASSPWPQRAAVVLTLALGLSIAHSVYRIPIQVSDSLEVIHAARGASSSLSLLADGFTFSSNTLRPMRHVQARLLSDLADVTGLSYHTVFRGTHAAIALALVALLAWAVRPRRWLDVAALGLSLSVLIGLHTFDAMMREAFPVNHYAEVAAVCLFVFGAALRPPRVARQALMLVALAWGLMLIESAVLIWVTIAACALLRMPGIRRSTAIAATGLLVLLLLARVAAGVTTPGIGSHSSGWGATVLSADELKERFEANPWPFYTYNVAGGALSLLVSEPRFGQYQLLAARERDELSPVVPVNVVSSLLATIGLGVFAWAALRAPRDAWRADQHAVLTAAAVTGVSAALCVTYIKDDILSTAGVFYALAAYFAARWLLTVAAFTRSLAVAAGVTVLLLLTSSLWAFRAVGTHYELARTAFVTRNDWGLESEAALAGGDDASQDALALTRQLRREALRQPTASPTFLPDWGERYWIE